MSRRILTITFQTLSHFVFSFPNCLPPSLVKPSSSLHSGNRDYSQTTAQPRHALTLPITKCKLYSRAVQTCQLRGLSCSGSVIGMRIRCFGVPGICLNICCDFPLDFDGHSSCQINLSWQNTQLTGEYSTMPGMSTSVFLGCESQSHLSEALPVPASCVALISLLSYFHLIFLAKRPHHIFKQTNQMPSEQKCHGKASSTKVLRHTLL